MSTTLIQPSPSADVQSDFENEAAQPVDVPYTELSSETLRAVIEHFVLREGTDYGIAEFTLEQKVAHVMRQLERGEARITYDPTAQSVTLVRVPR